MKKFITSLSLATYLFLLNFTPAYAAEFGFVWAKRLGGAGSDFVQDIAMDSNRNVYITGRVSGDADLNGDGDTTDQSESSSGYGNYDVIVSKFTSSGTFLWAKRLGGTDKDYGYGVAVDQSGNVYLTGRVRGDADLNADGDTTDSGESATGYGDYDIFVSKFNSSGTHQ